MIKKWMLALLLIETLCVTYLLRVPAIIPATTIIYTICGLGIASLLLYLPHVQLSLTNLIKPTGVVSVYQLMLLIFGGFAAYQFTEYWIDRSPLTYVDADMLPIMQVMAGRFLQGEWGMVYQPVQEIWNGIQPIYLPAMWMPFLLSEKFAFDPRWLTSFSVVLSFSIFIFLWKAHWQKVSGAILLFVAGILYLWLYTDSKHNFIRLSEEGLVVFYYSLLAMALLSENFLLIGIAAALCTLSRYAIAGWLPVMLIYLFFIRKQKRDSIRFLLSFVTMILLLVILPFGFEPIRIAIQHPEKYISHAIRIWSEAPEYFTQSMGFAKFFGPDNVELQHRLLLVLSFFIPLIFVLAIMISQKNSLRRYNNIALASLKLTIVIVYSFIDVTYQYLFFTSSFISLIAVAGSCVACEKNTANTFNKPSVS